ncbi:protein DD3-3-like [Dendronephthya gigantea]|uniref:protein DD3-3-like n=1 Tax=Dendronephthya gigantea TaxID=151771 RepID=UPI00106A5145|nr:protein DD3-3-like [Dendronephthya gigantea]
MRNLILSTLLSLCVLGLHVRGDVYLHNPRGSNNRLLGEGANRKNGNRVFDSQNNAKGGYNAGEKSEKKTTDWYHMQYFMSGTSADAPTILNLEWTNQHGCGDGDLNCNIVLQYMCRPSGQEDEEREMRNGKTELTPIYRKRNLKNPEKKSAERKAQSLLDRAYNEQWEWYDKCNRRERNKGLFTADQNLKRNTARYTRQNPNGNRRGYECPEERDYYPYWHPTDWIDIAVLGDQADCDFYESQSFNTKPKEECMEPYNKKKAYNEKTNKWRHASQYNNKADCEANNGIWVTFHNYLEETDLSEAQCTGEKYIWGIPYRSEKLDQLKGTDPEVWKKCLVALPKPECGPAPYSRSNHLGNGEGVVALNYPWKIPRFPSGVEQKCVLRIRYNISTNDYDVKNTFSGSNDDDSVIENDPEVEYGAPDNNKVPLQLAINTAQFGRTFQDRSHVFKIIKREAEFQNKRILNLNVRGKRGNIVQVYPAVEYDFTPKRMSITTNDYLHVQWTGSNRNPKNNAGEGRKQTDRSNMVAMQSPDKSFPYYGADSFENVQVVYALDGTQGMSSADAAVALATAGHFKNAANVPANLNQLGECNRQQLAQLDCYPPSYSGLLLRFTKAGTYYYMGSRNNNFTNRSQKGRLTVTD